MKRSHSQILSGIEPEKLPEEDYKHLYVILSYASGAYSHSLHRICVADLKSCSSRRKLNNLPNPIMELPCSFFPTSMGFFSVGSKIYMVGGGEISKGLKDIASRRCYVLDTCDDPIYSIRDVSPMNCEKLRPIVLGPLKGKFYVLDRTLASGDLEEFDPKTESWTLLPSPPIDPIGECAERFEEKLDDYKVLSYAIVEDQILFSTHKGIYAVNVCSKKWEHWNSLGGEVEFPFLKQSVFMDGFWYAFPGIYGSPVLAFSFDWDKGFRELGVMLPSRLRNSIAAGIMVPMGKNTLIFAHAGFSWTQKKYCYLTFDMCEFTCKSNGEPGHPKVESRRYSTKYTMDGLFAHLGLSACLVTPSI